MFFTVVVLSCVPGCWTHLNVTPDEIILTKLIHDQRQAMVSSAGT
jgi:hypothetical protein